MSKQQLITIVTLQLVAVLAVGWYLVLDHTQGTTPDMPPDSMIPATPTMAPPLDWTPNEGDMFYTDDEPTQFYLEDEQLDD